MTGRPRTRGCHCGPKLMPELQLNHYLAKDVIVIDTIRLSFSAQNDIIKTFRVLSFLQKNENNQQNSFFQKVMMKFYDLE